MYSDVIGTRGLVNNLRGINHSYLLIPLGQISLSLLQSVFLKLLFYLLFILFMLIFPDVFLNKLVNCLFILRNHTLGSKHLSLHLFECFDIKVIILPTGSILACLCVPHSGQLLLVGPRLALRVVLPLLDRFWCVGSNGYALRTASDICVGLGKRNVPSRRQVV